jgi:hypothetical protein
MLLEQDLKRRKKGKKTQEPPSDEVKPTISEEE